MTRVPCHDGAVLPRFEIVRRHRPVALLGADPALDLDDPVTGSEHPLPRPAPYAAVVASLPPSRTTTCHPAVTLALLGGDVRLAAFLADGALTLEVSDPGRTTPHRSRRHGRCERPPDAVALTLTGTHLTAWAREAGTWIARARVDLRDRVDTHDESWLGDLRVEHEGRASRLAAGAFGQLGLRDVRTVSHADGSPLARDGVVWLTATSAGPGFFDTGHTSVWRLDPATQDLEHTADLYFRRPGHSGTRGGTYGDHATHLLRDEEDSGWLAATSTWGDFSATDPARRVRVMLARSGDDLLRGEHVLDAEPLRLPEPPEGSVGQWDPHLVRDAGAWRVAWVSARRYFRFHPCVAVGPTLEALHLTGHDPHRRATEGVTWHRGDEGWRLLASDGPDSSRARRRRMPVLDPDTRDLAEVGVLDAPYPSNLPWPTVVPVDDGWLLVTFDGTPAGGPLLGYGTHGDLVVMRAEARR